MIDDSFRDEKGVLQSHRVVAYNNLKKIIQVLQYIKEYTVFFIKLTSLIFTKSIKFFIAPITNL